MNRESLEKIIADLRTQADELDGEEFCSDWYEVRTEQEVAWIRGIADDIEAALKEPPSADA